MRSLVRVVVVGFVAGCEPSPDAAQDARAREDVATAADSDSAAPDDAPARADASRRADTRADALDDVQTDAKALADLPSEPDVRMDAPADVSTDAPEPVDTPAGADASVTVTPGAVDPATVGPLRLIAPLSTSIVTSRRPTLRWGPMPAGAQARVTLCDDSACARTLAAIDTATVIT